MHPSTRLALLVSTLVLGALLLSLFSAAGWDLRPRIWQLNEILRQDTELSDYPYDFRALIFLNGIVTLSSPHASQTSVMPFLTTVEPELAGMPESSPEVEAARDRLWRVELRAINLMVGEPDVRSVVWALDRAWFHDHDVPLDVPVEPLRPMP